MWLPFYNLVDLVVRHSPTPTLPSCNTSNETIARYLQDKKNCLLCQIDEVATIVVPQRRRNSNSSSTQRAPRPGCTHQPHHDATCSCHSTSIVGNCYLQLKQMATIVQNPPEQPCTQLGKIFTCLESIRGPMVEMRQDNKLHN